MFKQAKKLSMAFIAIASFIIFATASTAHAAPTVVITSPTASTTFSYGSMYDTITIGGTATGSPDIVAVTFSVDTTGDVGTSTGTTTWSAVVELDAVQGSITNNVITVTAIDTNGSTSVDTLTVNYSWQYPYVSFVETSFDAGLGTYIDIDIRGNNLVNASSTDVQILYDPSVLTFYSRGNGPYITDSSVATTTSGSDILLTLSSDIASTSSSTAQLNIGYLRFLTASSEATTTVRFGTFTVNRDSGGNQNASTGTAAIVLVANPGIGISSPSYETMNYYSSNDQMYFSGSASDNVGIRSIVFLNDLNNATGTMATSGNATFQSWDGYVTLAAGTNNIAFVITDTSGNTATDTIAVVYLANDPEISFSTTSMSVASSTSFTFDVGANYLSEAETIDIYLEYDPNKVVYDNDNTVFSIEGGDYSLLSAFISTSTVDADTESAYFTLMPLISPDNTTVAINLATIAFRTLTSGGTTTISFATSSVVRSAGYSVNSVMSAGTLLSVYVEVPADTTDPSIAISYPSSSATYNYYSASSSFLIQGTSSDNVAVSSVTYSNSRGGSGSMTGTSTWTGSVVLATGTNIISIVAQDAAGNTATDTISVYHLASDPAVSFATTSITTATSTNVSFGVSGNYFSEAQTVGLNVLYDPTKLTYSTTTLGANFTSAVISTSTVGSLRRLSYTLTPSSVPYSASSSMTVLTPTFTTGTTTGTTTVSFGTSTVNRSSFNSNVSTSTTVTIVIPSPDSTAPVRSSGSPSGNQSAGVSAVTLSLATDENATCRYSTSAGFAYAGMTSFSTTGGLSHSLSLSGLAVTSYIYYVKCQDAYGNINADDYTISFTIVAASSGSGSSGGGSSVSTTNTSTTTRATTTVATTTPSVATTTPTVSAGTSTAALGQQDVPAKTDIEQEAGIVYTRTEYIVMDNASKGVYAKVTAGRTLNQNQKYALAYFIQNGTYLTKKLGAGERGGVVNSFFAAFGRLPTTEKDWQDVVKIARGRWPGQANPVAEANAKVVFKKIYKRDADMKNARDNAAVTIVAYGLRSITRNTVNEAASIKSFRAIYGKAPVSATDWDIVRAIAYSGAKR